MSLTGLSPQTGVNAFNACCGAREALDLYHSVGEGFDVSWSGLADNFPPLDARVLVLALQQTPSKRIVKITCVGHEADQGLLQSPYCASPGLWDFQLC